MPKNDSILRRLYVYIKPHLLTFIICFLMVILIVLLDLLGPFLQGIIVSILRDDVIVYSQIVFVLVIYFISLILSSILTYFEAMKLQVACQSIMYKMRADLLNNLENLTIAQINSQPIGRYVSAVTSDTNNLNNFFTNVIVNLLKNLLTLIFVLIIMFIINTWLTSIILTLTPIIVISTVYFKKYSRRAYRNVRKGISDVNAFLSENLSGIKLTQVFNQEKKKFAEFQVKNNKLMRDDIRQIIIFSIFRPLIYSLYVLSCIIIIYVGIIFVIGGNIFNITINPNTIDLALFIVFYGYIVKFFDPIQQLADQFNTIQSSFASAERIFDVLDIKVNILDSDDAIELNDLKGDIEFRNVWFAYNDENWILKDVSFTVNAGQTAAFVGATGAGKTTILALIVRNYEIQRGQILIDGIDIRRIKIESLRKNIGQMLQDVFLFSGTIYSNITMRDDSISLPEVKKACKYVNACDFIENLDGEYNYVVKERGSNFSSGQRQLLSFARTIVHKPKIMILDEATANIDTETEMLIQDSLEKMMNVGTMLIVAHRLSTVQNADKIIVLHKGEIVEEGNHMELINKKGLYYSLYEIQYKNIEHNEESLN